VIEHRLHVVCDGLAVDVEAVSDGTFSADPAAVFQDWQRFRDWAETIEPDGAALDHQRLGNPVPAPRQVFAVGANYASHVEEAGAQIPSSPLIFTKFPTCLVGPYDDVELPTTMVDWEVELVVVIGVRAHRVADSDAWRHVAGLTVGQDITERAVQLSGDYPQFSMGKSYPGFGPLGPVLVTPDEFADPDDLALGCAVDGHTMQQGRTRELIFAVPELISRLSAICPLLPGDVIFTGTPAGVGLFRTPGLFLSPGHTLTSWVEGIGELHNRMIAGPDYPTTATISDEISEER
jgi:2-keto-4-pentenoate hydratase/2-oxohepta-3-ene-1,7-dioic acid hydratase in catechol pathway